MHAWENIFSLENIKDYARAGNETLDYLRVLWTEGFNTIVVPSRGAMPIYDTAHTAWYMYSQKAETLEQKMKSRLEIIRSPIGRELVLPFSADPLQTDRTQTSKDIRRFWTKVLGAIVRREGTSPYLKYYQFLVEQFSNGLWEDRLPRHLPDQNFIFIDTVVSGRAICEIFDAFESEGLTSCYFLLLVDRNGSAMEKRYKEKIDMMVASGRCTLIQVRQLFTEDRGPAVSGIWSTVYPELMTRVRDEYSWAADSYGAGSYYIRVANNLDGMKNAGYNLPVTVIYGSIRTAIMQSIRDRYSTLSRLKDGISQERVLQEEERNDFQIGYLLHHLIKDVEKYRPFDRSTTLRLAEPRILEHMRRAKVTVSSSHLVRVHLSDADITNRLSILNDYLKSSMDVFKGNDYFINP
jgi:hypothetical protein